MSQYYVYVLKSREGRLYIGSTTDLDRRMRQHQEGKAGWTRSRGPWELVHVETFIARSEALHCERRLKTGKANQELRQRFVPKKRPDGE